MKAGLIALGIAACAAPADAACRLALALAFDVSRSVDAVDYDIQRGGILAALADPVIIAAMLEPEDHVALSVYEWSGRGYQELVVDWTEVHGLSDIEAIAARIGGHQRYEKGLPTGLGHALEFGRRLMRNAPDCVEHVLDMSGDGQNNDGMSPEDAYRRRDFGDLLVNGLAIGGHEADIVIYYRREVIRGPGAFVEVAPTQADFPRAFRRKLERELTEKVFGTTGPRAWRG
jgi:hypothetical protein